MNELALFAGAGGGILGGKLLGWRTVCAVEWDDPRAATGAERREEDREEDRHQETMSEHITREQLAAILTHEGLVPRDAVEDPEGFDGGRTVAAIAMAAAAINIKQSAGEDEDPRSWPLPIPPCMNHTPQP